MKSLQAKLDSLALIILCFLCLSAPGQEVLHPGHYGLPVDVTHRYIISHQQLAEEDFEQQALTEPRILYNWVQHHDYGRVLDHDRVLDSGRVQPYNEIGIGRPLRPPVRLSSHYRSSIAVDWHFPLGSGTVLSDYSPVKYGFNVNQTPSCSSDYVAYALNVAGSPTQPNLVILNNLYVNAAGTGLCPGTLPTVAFAYNLTSTGGNGILMGSPGLSLDGTKLAYIETVTTSTAGVPCTAPCSIFHVIKLGTTGTNGSFSSVTNTYTSALPGVGNNASVTNLVFSNKNDTRSFPFIDYRNDFAYFGDDNGQIYKTTCVFAPTCVTPALATGYSTGVGIAVGAAGNVLTVPIVDVAANKAFVGASDGKVYVVNLANCSGTPVTCSGTVGLAVGVPSLLPLPTPGCFGVYDGVEHPPLIDVTFHVWFATAGCGTGNAAMMVEGDYSGVAQGPGINMSKNAWNTHSGMPDDNYYNTPVGATTVGGNVYFTGPNGSKQLVLYAATMTPKSAGGLSASNPPVVASAGNIPVPGNGQSESSSVTIIQNGVHDWLFFSQLSVPKNACNNSVTDEGCVFSFDVFNSSGVSITPSGITASASEANGTSDIVVDNVSAAAGASNIYFANQRTTTTSGAATCTTGVGVPSYCAVKLTQATLQ